MRRTKDDTEGDLHALYASLRLAAVGMSVRRWRGTTRDVSPDGSSVSVE